MSPASTRATETQATRCTSGSGSDDVGPPMPGIGSIRSGALTTRGTRMPSDSSPPSTIRVPSISSNTTNGWSSVADTAAAPSRRCTVTPGPS